MVVAQFAMARTQPILAQSADKSPEKFGEPRISINFPGGMPHVSVTGPISCVLPDQSIPYNQSLARPIRKLKKADIRQSCLGDTKGYTRA